MTAVFKVGDVFDRMSELEDGSVDLVLTSPPFLALRSYLPDGDPNKAKEIGSEPTPADYLDVLLRWTAECRRVLAPHGSLAVELGDTYAGSGGAGGDYNSDGMRDGQPKFSGSNIRKAWITDHDSGRRNPAPGWPLAKSLVGVPQLYMLSLAYGRNILTGTESPAGMWRIRNVKPWIRTNPPVGCVDDETEALTPDGWKRHDELSDGDLIAAYDPVMDSCRFARAKFVRWHREHEPMIAIEKRKTSQRLTTEHRCLVRTRKRPEPFVVLADHLTNEHQVLLTAPLEIDVAELLTRERAELLGWYIAEGSPHHRQARIRQSLSKNKAKVQRIRALLEAVGAEFREDAYRQQHGNWLTTFHIKGPLAGWLNHHHKRLPMQYATGWPLETVRALFDGLVGGDGHRRAAGGVLFHQKQRDVVDAVQIIALRLGLRCSVTYQPTLGASRGVGGAWQATIGQGSDSQRWTKVRKWDGVGIPRQTYTGTVWCPQVETLFWLARRDGRTFITGNSLGDKERPATSYVIVACTSANRYFDLDAVRTMPVFQRASGSRVDYGTANRGLKQVDGGEAHRIENNPAGAPPRDWWHQVDAIIDAEIDARAGQVHPRQQSGRIDNLASANRDASRGDAGKDFTTLGGGSVGARGVHIRRALEDAGILETLEALDISPKGYAGAHYACVDEITEALTPHGWKHHNELRDGDLIASWSLDTETWRFEPAAFHRYPFDGDLIAIDKRVTTQRLTPNHRVVYRTSKDLTPRFREAETLTPGCRLPLAAPMEDGGVGPGEKAAALAGWFCTEGGLSAWSRWPIIHQSESANPQHVQTIRSLLDALGADYTERRRERVGVTGKRHTTVDFVIRGALAEWLRQFHKSIPMSVVFGWSPIDSRSLFDAMIDGDGNRRSDGRVSFIQKDLAVAEAFQLLAIRLGYRTTLTRHRVNNCWVVHVSPARWVDLRTGYAGLRPAATSERYRGIVWCPSVSTGAWLARRNGQPFITGNTWPPELCRQLIDEMCPPGGTVLDPFVGSGTTLAVASGMARHSIGIDLDPRNADLAAERVGMFLEIDEREVPA